MNGECKALEAAGCKSKPSSPCSGASWNGVPDCEWDVSLCSVLPPTAQGDGGELDVSQGDDTTNISNQEDKKANYPLIALGVALILSGGYLLFPKRKRR